MAAPAAAAAANSVFVVGKTDEIKKTYKFGKQLGLPGQFGYALQAEHLPTHEVRAVKVISKARFTRSADKEFHFAQLRSEIEVMKRMDHPNIIKFHEVFENETELYIVMEMCSGGELFDRIKEKGTYSEHDAAEALRQIFEGIEYMHSKKIAHCDLKPDNFLYSSHDKNAKVKIIDFGMSKFVRDRQHFRSLCGTPYYMAPEVIMGQYNHHSDIWSLGVVMFVMLFGYPPFYADPEQYGTKTDDAIFELIKKGFKPKAQAGYGPHFPEAIPVSDAAKDLMAKILTRDVAKRYTAREVLDHPWMKGQASKEPLDAAVMRNLKTFNANSKLKQAVLVMMVGTLTDSEIREMRKTFEAIDENHDGLITAAELKKAMGRVDGSKSDVEEVERIMKMADINGDGVLSYQELLLTAVDRKLRAKEERLWDTFRRLDLDGDGKVSAKEIEQVLGKENAAELIKEADTNGDGFISIDEFVKLWSGKDNKEDSVNK